ncbi:uncharacterized protein LOC111048611 isoform X2 [Nilaparvata lugens]|uniref:uncharacterized protein LOC111048611 isoform X2 n=1 Tax=Nilaparvata lugens TaxID=108931 RepID=UPI000B992BC4|nr:uncharacterized protein LOC111048611 isoform X2 [Nilaparvata lugens]
MGGTKFLVQWEEHPTHLATRLGYLLEHQSLVDVTLMCNTHTLKVHRSVLAACSPYFERQLGNHPLIVLKDMKFSVLKSLVEFMYCGETSVAEENLNPLMEAAKFFEVKGLSSMTKEAISDQTSPTQSSVPSVNGISPSGRGGRRPGAGRGRRTASIPMAQANPPTESAQILLSLSGNPGRHARLTPNQRLSKVFTQDGTIIDAPKTLVRNGNILAAAGDRPARGGFEPRRRGRRRNPTNLMYGRNNNVAFKESEASRIAVENLKKEMDGQADQPDDPNDKLTLWNTNTIDKSPLLASLLSKAENSKLKLGTDGNVCESTSAVSGEQETVSYPADGEGVSSSNAKYLEALKVAGLPTDVPILIDNGDGNYVTLTEEFLMNVMDGKEEYQFQVTEGSSEVQEVGEGIVLQDGTIVMDRKQVPLDIDKNLVSSSGDKKDVIRPVRQLLVKERHPTKQSDSTTVVSPLKSAEESISNNGSKRSVQEIISEAAKAELDPDAVILIEETENSKFEKHVLSSKEINALKALNEQMQQLKKQTSDSSTVPVSPLADVGLIGGNTQIAELKLSLGKSKSSKSILSQMLECVQGLGLDDPLKKKKFLEDATRRIEELKKAETETETSSVENKTQKVKGQPKLMQLEIIDGDGERIKGFQVEVESNEGINNDKTSQETCEKSDDFNTSKEQIVMDRLPSLKDDIEETGQKPFIVEDQHITQNEFEEIIDESVNNADISAKDDDMLNLLTMDSDVAGCEKIPDCNVPDIGHRTVQNSIKDDEDLLIHNFNQEEFGLSNNDPLPDKDNVREEENLCKGGEEGTEQAMGKEAEGENLCLDEQQNMDRSLVENGLVLNDKGLSVEQALEVMMGDPLMKKMIKKDDIDEDSSQPVNDQAVLLPEVTSDDSELQLALETSQQDESNSTQEYQVVYVSEKDEMDSQNSQEIVIVEPADEMVLDKEEDMLDALVSLKQQQQEEEEKGSPKRRRSMDPDQILGLDEGGGKRLKLVDSSGEESCGDPLINLVETSADQDLALNCDDSPS